MGIHSLMARIILAEDDTGMRQFLSMALEKAGHVVESKDDGLSAFHCIKDSDEPFDLLLADIVMPGMDGIELSQKAVQVQPGIKVMFITGFAAVAMDRLKNEDEQPPVLSKPFHLNELVEQINTLLAA